MYKKNIVLYSFYLTFILNFSLIFSYDCNDTSALNYDSSSNDSSGCVYFDIPNAQYTDEDVPYIVDLFSFASGPSDLLDNFLFDLEPEFNCDNIANIQNCNIDESILTIIFDVDYDLTSQEITLPYEYNGQSNDDFFYIVINPINDAPEVIIPEFLSLEASYGTLFQYTIDVVDPDHTIFSFELIDNPFDVSIVNLSTLAIVSYIPENNAPFVSCPGINDDICFSFEVAVGDYGEPLGIDTEIFYVKIIEEINELPIIDITILTNELDRIEDSNLSLGINVNDENFSSDNLSVISIYSRLDYDDNHQSQYVEVDLNEEFDFKSNFMPLPNWNGTFEIKVIADNLFGSTTKEFEISLTAINDSPAVSGLDVGVYNEGICIENTDCPLYIELLDPDQDGFDNEDPFDFIDLDYTLEWNTDSNSGSQNIMSSFVSQGSDNYVINYFHTTDEDWYGTEDFKIIVNDGHLEYEVIFPVTIDNVNDSPQILGELPDEIIEEDGQLTINVNAVDIDSNLLSYAVEDEGDFIDFESTDSGEITITPKAHYNGLVNVSVSVNDSDNSSDSIEFLLTISSQNDMPLTENLSISLNEDGTKFIDLHGASNLCSQSVFDNSDGSISCDCEDDEFVQGACDIEDSNLSYSLYSEPVHGVLSFENNDIINLNDDFNGSIIIYTPLEDYFGEDSFEYKVCDTQDSCNTGLVLIEILNVNDSPIINCSTASSEGICEISLDEDEINFHIDLIASDNDNDELIYQITHSPDNGHYTIQNNTVLYSPYPDYFGEDQFSFSVSDGMDTIDANYSINILAVNDSPVLGDFSDQVSFAEDTFGSLLLLASDVDNPELTYSVTSGTTITVNLDEETDIITFNAPQDYHGIEEFTVSVCDLVDEENDNECVGLDDSQVVTVTVTPVNDSPILNSILNVSNINCIENTCSFNEDELFILNIQASDIDNDNDNLDYYIKNYENYFSVSIENNIFTFEPDLEHYYGDIELPFKVCDRGMEGDQEDPLCVEQDITIHINSVNDIPRSRKISKYVDEECPEQINLNGTLLGNGKSFCFEDVIDGVLCDCDENDGYSGACDIESSELIYEIISGPSHGSASISDAILTYNPEIDYISNDNDPVIIQYRVIDSNSQTNNEVFFNEENECIDEDNCPIIAITVEKLNDAPIINCPNESIDEICEISLSNLMPLYEDCSQEEQSNNNQCDGSVGLLVEDLRLGYDNVDNDICSNEHLWHDVDCNDFGDSSEFNFGIAVDVASWSENNENNKGIWMYKRQTRESFTAFEDNCNFKLLNKNTEIKFYPNDNYYTTENMETFPQIKFYAWDHTIHEDGACLTSLDNRSDCDNGTSFSEHSIIANLEIESINDSPESNEIPDISYDEYCQTNDNPSCGKEIIEVPINFSDPHDLNEDLYSDNMYYYVSSKTTSSNNQQSLFTNIQFTDDYYGSLNLSNEGLEFNSEILELKNEELYLKLQLTEHSNGTAEVTLVGFDRENFEESLFTLQTFEVTINQINNKIKDFTLIPDIYNYESENNLIITNQGMIFPYDPSENDDKYIKYPSYFDENNESITLNNITAVNYQDIRNYMLEHPYQMNDIFFMWNRSFDDNYLDYDIDPMLNATPYILYFRLEFLDKNNNIYVLKDSIVDDFSGIEKAYAQVKFSGKKYKTYIEDTPYDPESDIRASIDTTGTTFYNWRIVGANYVGSIEDINPEYNFYNTSTSLSENEYAVNLHIPKLNYDFVLNDIYTNYYDLYLSPIPTNFAEINNYENITFNQNSELYVNRYTGNFINSLETININEIEFGEDNVLNQNIFLASDDFNTFGSYKFYTPMQNDVGTMNLSMKEINYSRVIPNVYTQIESSSGNFNIEFMGENNFNILFYEKEPNEIIVNDTNIDILSSLYIIKVNNANASQMKINYNLNNDLENLNSLSFAIYEDGNIYKIDSNVNNGILSADIEEFGSFLVILDSQDFDDEIPGEISILSCFPNPFNPSTTINYFLEQDADIKFQIFNISGQSIYNSRIISSKEGSNNFSWNALDDFGNQVPSGIYIVSMNLDDKVFSQKITFLK